MSKKVTLFFSNFFDGWLTWLYKSTKQTETNFARLFYSLSRMIFDTGWHKSKIINSNDNYSENMHSQIHFGFTNIKSKMYILRVIAIWSDNFWFGSPCIWYQFFPGSTYSTKVDQSCNESGGLFINKSAKVCKIAKHN